MDELTHFVGSFNEDTLEVVTCPLDGVFDLIREVFNNAKRKRFLRRVNRFTIRLSFVRDNHLGAALSSEST